MHILSIIWGLCTDWYRYPESMEVEIDEIEKFEGAGDYRCPCGLRIVAWQYHATLKRRAPFGLGRCTATASGRHEFTYIHANGLPSFGPRHS